MADKNPTAEALALGEELRRVVGTFVRSIRREADTPTGSQSETLGFSIARGR